MEEDFSSRLKRSIEFHGIIEKPVLCSYGIISGKDRVFSVISKEDILKYNQNLISWKDIADKYKFEWREVKDKEEYLILRTICGLLRKEEKRDEIIKYAEYLKDELKIPTEQITKTIFDKLQGIVTLRTIERHLPNYLKRQYTKNNIKNESKSDSLSFLSKEELERQLIACREECQRLREQYQRAITNIEKQIEDNVAVIKSRLESELQTLKMKLTIYESQNKNEEKGDDKNE